MDSHSLSNSRAAKRRVGEVSEVHNASVDEDVAGAGGCAQVYLATGAVCTLRHGHLRSCEFSPPGEARAVLTKHKADEHW